VNQPRHSSTKTGLRSPHTVLAVALLLAALALPPAAVAVTPGFEGKVAFQSRTSAGDDWDIWIADAQEREPLPAASPLYNETQPAWAGAGCAGVPCGDEQPPEDGGVSVLEQVLVFASDEPSRGGPRDIYAVFGSETEATLLVGSPGSDDGSPALCCGLDSDRLAFDSDRSGDRDIYVAPLASAASACPIASTPLPEANPEWSPNGDEIAFERHGPGGPQIFVVDVGPGCQYENERLVTPDQPPSFEPTWFEWTNIEDPLHRDRAHRIAFRGPDDRPGSNLYFVEHPYGELPPDSPFLDAAAVDEGVLIDDAAEDVEPSWTPFGRGLVFASDRGGGYDIWFLDANGDHPPEPAARTDGEDREPAVQPLPATAAVQGIRICGRACRKRRRSSPGRSVSLPTGVAEPRSPAGRCRPGGTAGDDVIRGTPRRDVLCGLGGRDILIGGRGDDTLRGGRGDDLLRGGPGADRLLGESGRDRLRGQSGRDVLLGGTGRDRLLGGAQPDRMFGQSGGDRLDARGGGRDRVVGGAGTYTALAGRRDVVRGIERRRR
jgi:hypothetical protein